MIMMFRKDLHMTKKSLIAGAYLLLPMLLSSMIVTYLGGNLQISTIISFIVLILFICTLFLHLSEEENNV